SVVGRCRSLALFRHDVHKGLLRGSCSLRQAAMHGGSFRRAGAQAHSLAKIVFRAGPSQAAWWRAIQQKSPGPPRSDPGRKTPERRQRPSEREAERSNAERHERARPIVVRVAVAVRVIRSVVVAVARAPVAVGVERAMPARAPKAVGIVATMPAPSRAPMAMP